MNVSKVIAWRKLKKSLLHCKISRFLKLSALLFWKLILKMFSHLRRYDIETTNNKISGKNIVPQGGARDPDGGSFLPLFWNFANFAKCWVSKKFQIENVMVYGNKHSLTSKVSFMVISLFIMDLLVSIILFYKTNFFLIYSAPLWIFKRFN